MTRLPHFLFCALTFVCLVSAPLADARGYRHFKVGDLQAPTPGKVSPGLMLMGGGDRNFEIMRWFFAKAGNGHIVVLRASQTTDVADEFFYDVGGVKSVETFVFKSRDAATDPKILASLARADGIFIAGGDQARYVRFWKGTPIAAALDAHVKAGKPLGGTSAGLAILGEYLYGAMDDGSIQSPEALADPLGPANTIEHDFLHLDLLKGVVTDTHFKERDRLGRLFAFVAKAESIRGSAGTPLYGLGVDESAALAIEADGSGRVYATDAEGGAFLVRGGFAEKQQLGQPLQLRRIEVIGIGQQSTLHLPEARVEAPAFRHFYRARNGDIQRIAATMLVIHGGAGVERSTLNANEEQQVRTALDTALRKGHAQLLAGKPALEAVTAAITVLEDDPNFNAGRGAVFTHDGHNEMDAAVMDGQSLRAGSVAGVRNTRNPVLLARAVMDKSEHVMMVGDGADAFGKSIGIEQADAAWFRTEKRWQQLQRRLQQEQQQAALKTSDEANPGRKFTGTVGAVALDIAGHLAAGTSTGGMTNKRFGRVGDAPIIGAGTYANGDCAVSGTGWGEFYIRATAAQSICSRMHYLNESPTQAGEAIINVTIPALGGDGGAIVLGADGDIALPFNTEGMYRGWIGADGIPHVAIYPEEKLELPQSGD
jgi:L-asparaginase / beta-aspartyl-peptidase